MMRAGGQMSRGGPSNVLTSQRRPEKSGLKSPGEGFVFFSPSIF